eukprot:bmy_20931T0
MGAHRTRSRLSMLSSGCDSAPASGAPQRPVVGQGGRESPRKTQWKSTRCRVVRWWGGGGDEGPTILDWLNPGALGVNLLVEETKTKVKHVIKQVRGRACGTQWGWLPKHTPIIPMLEKGDVTVDSSPPAVTKEDPAGWGGG